MGAPDRHNRDPADPAEQRAAPSRRQRRREGLARESTEAPTRRRAATRRDREPHDAEPAPDPVDESSEESFPASDPPSWTPNTSLGPHGD